MENRRAGSGAGSASPLGTAALVGGLALVAFGVSTTAVLRVAALLDRRRAGDGAPRTADDVTGDAGVSGPRR